MLFSEYPWLIVFSTLFFCFFMAVLIRAMLRRRARAGCRGTTNQPMERLLAQLPTDADPAVKAGCNLIARRGKVALRIAVVLGIMVTGCLQGGCRTEPSWPLWESYAQQCIRRAGPDHRPQRGRPDDQRRTGLWDVLRAGGERPGAV